jgi:hypothetical protein
MKSIRKNIDGRECDIYFFQTWSSYAHPVKLNEPITFDEAQTLDAFYAGAFVVSDGRPMLLRATKWINHRRETRFERGRTDAKSGHNYYHIELDDDDRILRCSRLSTEDAFSTEQLLHVVVDEAQSPIRAEIVRREFVYQYDYSYDKNGKLVRVVIKTPEEETTLNY